MAPFIVARVWHRTVLNLSDLLRIGFVLSLLLVGEPGELWLLFRLLSAKSFLSSIFHPANLAILPDIVANESELGAAYMLDSLSLTAMIALGIALAGVVTNYLGIQASIVIDAFTFFISAFLLLQLKHLASRNRVRRARNPYQSPEDQQATFVDLLRSSH